MAAAEALDCTVVGTRYGRGKRARTELADATNTNWRDWANLTAGPPGMIVERVLADDVAGYLRFRAVCSSWRRSTPSPHAHDIFDRRFHPRRWIILLGASASHTKRRDFLNISTGERIQVDIPELRYHFVFGHTPDGLILLCQKGTGAVRLLNPLTRQLTLLPNATSLSSDDKSWRSSTSLRKSMESHAFSAGLADSSTLVLHFLHYELAVSRPNVERWGRFPQPSYSTLSFENRFYCFTWEGIMAVDFTGAGQPPPHVAVAVKVDKDFFRADHHWNLVDNGGELVLVRGRDYGGACNPWKYEVYLVDLDAGKMVPMLGLRGRALFVCHGDTGRGCAMSVHAGLSSSINADTVYECRRVRGEGGERQLRINAYDLLQEDWIKLDFCACRGSIVDYLSHYVCLSEDNLVPVRPLGSVGPANESLSGPRKRKWRRKRVHKANPKVTGEEWVN